MTTVGAGRGALLLLLLALGAAGMAALSAAAAAAGTKAIGAVVVAFGLVILATLLRDLTLVLLAALVIAISYNRQFYSFDGFVGDYGPRGLYWTLADAASLAILGALLLAQATGDRAGHVPRRALSIEVPMALMIVAIAASGARLPELLPGVAEMMRIGKYLAMFLMFRWLMTRERCWAILVALGLLVLLQTALGVVQAVLGAGGSGLSAIAEQSGEMARRATGTLGHPNMYAPFLLTFVPGFAAVALVRFALPIRLAAALVAGAGGLAILLSQSRVPVLGAAVAIAATSVTLALRGRVPIRRVAGGATLIALLGIIAAAPFADRIAARFTGDLGGSVTFRMGYNEAAVAIWQRAPMLGVGPGGFVPALAQVDPIEAATNQAIQESRLTANVKTIAPVHNVYLWILAELGAIGLAAFLVLLVALGLLFHAAGTSGTGPPEVFFIGVFWGLLAVTAQQLTDFSLWWDHHMALLMLLAAVAAFLRDSRMPA